MIPSKKTKFKLILQLDFFTFQSKVQSKLCISTFFGLFNIETQFYIK